MLRFSFSPLRRSRGSLPSSRWAPRPSRAPPGAEEGAVPPLAFGGAAFRVRPLSEIIRALLIFRFCSHPLLVRNAALLLTVCRKVLGKGLFNRVMKVTAYGQFVAGETLPEIHGTLSKLSQLGIRPLLAVPMEEDVGERTSEMESWYDQHLQRMLNCVDLSTGSCPQPMMQLKVTALMSAELCKTLTLALRETACAQDLAVHRLVEVMEGKDLTFRSLSDSDSAHFHHSLRRLAKIGRYASDRAVRVLVDAEYTYLNPAICLVTLAMMIRFNSHEAVVWNTYQCYLKDTLRTLCTDIETIRSLSLCLGVKLVRGAYMDRERELAQRQGEPDPVHNSWGETNESYQRALDLLLKLTMTENPRHRLIIATHNTESVCHAVDRMQELGIPRDQDTVGFAQLLGMCDHVSLTLGQAGYRVYKSIPYGPVEDVIPYLIRRAQENLSVLQGLRMERELLWQELWRRLFRKRARTQ